MITPQFAELVFGFVYAVGTDADPVVGVLENYLRQYQYKTETFRISEHLRSLDLEISFESSSAFDKMKALMDAGNEARKRAKSDKILAAMAVNEIASHREEDETKRPAQRQRVAHVIRSLKRPEEVLLLRDVYRPGFFLIAIAALTQVRMASNLTDAAKQDRFIREAVNRISEALFRVANSADLSGISLEEDLKGAELIHEAEKRGKQGA